MLVFAFISAHQVASRLRYKLQTRDRGKETIREQQKQDNTASGITH